MRHLRYATFVVAIALAGCEQMNGAGMAVSQAIDDCVCNMNLGIYHAVLPLGIGDPMVAKIEASSVSACPEIRSMLRQRREACLEGVKGACE